MSYIGQAPSTIVSENTFDEFNFTATSNQTTFTGVDADGKTLVYNPGNSEVFLNGVRLEEADFTATNGTSVVLATGATTNDVMSVKSFTVFEVSDTVSKASGGAFGGNISVTGTVTATSYSGDGSSLSGISTDLVGDITPQLGGNLDTNGKNIASLTIGGNSQATITRADTSPYDRGFHFSDSILPAVASQPDTSSLVGLGSTTYKFKELHTTSLQTTSTGIIVTGNIQAEHGTTSEYVNSIRNTADNLQLLLGTTTGGLLNIQGKTINTNAAYKIALQAEGGNVGIGTTSPTALLQITPPNEHQDSFRIYRGGSSGYELNYLNMSLYQGNTVFNTTSTDSSGKRYLFQINGTEKVRIDQEGEVMFGTTVQGRAAEGANRLTIANDSGHSGLTIRSGTGGSDYYGSINFSDSEGGTGEYAGSIYYAHGTLGDKLVLATTGSDRITLSGSGNHVGIGVQTSPTYALDIKGPNFQDSSIRLERTDTGASNDPGIYFVNNQSTTSGGLGGIWFTNSYHSGNAYAMIRARTQETTSSGKLQFITSNGVVGNSTPAKVTLNHAGDILYGGQFNFHVVSGFSAPNVAFQYDFYRATYGIPIKVTAAISHWNSSYMSYTEGMYWGFNTAMTSDVQHSYNGGNGSWTISFPTNDIIRVRMNGDASYNYASGWYIKVEGNLRREYTSS